MEAPARLRSRSCIIDGEAVCCGDHGVPSFDHIRYRRHDASVFLYAFDLIELNGGRPAARTVRRAQGDAHICGGSSSTQNQQTVSLDLQHLGFAATTTSRGTVFVGLALTDRDQA